MAETDREALAAFYHATDGPNWKISTGWDTDADLSDWYGVKTNDQGRVVILSLFRNNLRGHIPRQLGDLGALKSLDLSINRLEGSIPPELGNLAALEILDLRRNQLSGSIPKELGALTELKELSLDRNELSGHIPPQLGDLGVLVTLSLSNNKLDGSIPPELGKLTALKKLRFWNNQLSGVIPPQLGALNKLTQLSLSNNQLSGPIPPELGKLTALQTLYLFNNQLSGTIPPELGNLTALQTLYLHSNELSGLIPEALGNLSKLEQLWLSDNRLTEIPPEVLELCRARLQQTSWGSNQWSRPPSTVLESGFESALGWWEDVKRFGEGKSNKLKLVLVGLAEAGKTTVVRHFTSGSVPTRPDRTVGIEITPDWRPVHEARLQVSVWDFAGQEDYYSSHQLFLTRGALFLLVVDLRTFYDEVRQSGVENYSDPHRRIYWWLEMLHMRVPGAALALVGSHVDQMEEYEADAAGAFLLQVVGNFIEDKAKNASMRQSSGRMSADVTTAIDTDHPRDAVSGVQPLGPRLLPATPLVLHSHVFKVSLARASVTELRQWIVKAASAQKGCPPGFNFPAVDQVVPKAWIEAYDAMDALSRTTPCVLWSEAEREFLERTGGSLPDGGEVLLRAMQHREAEGGVLLSLANPSDPVGTDMLHLDPAWLVELVRRLTDHNLVDNNRKKQNDTMKQLREYATESRISMAGLWETHKEYRRSGCLDRAYLRFLWIHRKIQGTQSSAVHLSESEFESVVSTMARLMVMYGSSDTDKLVVPARLPEYGPERVVERPLDNVTDIVLTVQCSFGQVYPPPGIVGRFLAWSTKQVHCFDECWQHGAFLRYSYDAGQYRVFLYESIAEETLRCAGLTLGVQAPSPVARNVLEELKASLHLLVADSAYGYPGLKYAMLFGDTAETEPTLLKHLRDLRALLDNQEELIDRLGTTVDRLEETASKLGGVTNQLVQQELLAASAKRKEYPYPRLVILVPVDEDGDADGNDDDGEADGGGGQKNNERIQRVGWDRWRKAWESLSLPDVGLHCKFRLRFLCEYSLEEVPCGPNGLGYPIKQLKDWVKQCVPLIKASLWILRVAVGTVSHVDLPLNHVLKAAVKATGAEVLNAIGTEVPNSVGNDPVPVFGEGATVEQIQSFKYLQGTAYTFLCEFMKDAEPPPRRLSKCLPCCRPVTPPTDLTPSLNWKDSMVQVRNGNGRWAWVLKKNEEAYCRENGKSAGSVRPPMS